MEEMSNELFIKEIQTLWQNVSVANRNLLGDIIRDYFEGDRAERIINKLQITL